MTFSIYGRATRHVMSETFQLAVLVSDIQPMLKKIFRNFQKWMLSPQSTKVPLGSIEDFNIFDNILE